MTSDKSALHPAVAAQPLAPARQREWLRRAIDALTAEPFRHRSFPDMLERMLPGRSGMALHVFSTRLVRRRDRDTSAIHTHYGRIRSHVLLGTLVNRIYPDDECKTWTDLHHDAGQTWTTTAPIIHRTYPDSDLVVTLFSEWTPDAAPENQNIDPPGSESYDELNCDLAKLTQDVLNALQNRLAELEGAAGYSREEPFSAKNPAQRQPWQNTSFQPGPAHDEAYLRTVRRRALAGQPDAVWILPTLFGNRVEAGSAVGTHATYCCGADPTFQRVVYEALIRALDRGHGPTELPQQQVKPLWNDQPCLHALLRLAGMVFAYEGLVRLRGPDRSDARLLRAAAM